MSNDYQSYFEDAKKALAAQELYDEIVASNNNTVSDDTSEQSTDESMYYHKDGEVIEKHWQVIFVFVAYFIAFMGSYAAIRLLEHGLWRSERERKNASWISRNPRFSTAFVIGSCTIWSMHFVGMQAVHFENLAMCYNYWQTTLSLVLSVSGVWAGVVVASFDIFSGHDRVSKLRVLLKDVPSVSSKQDRRLASRHIHMVALFHKLHWIAAGSLLAALGALSMHYLGMYAMKGPFRIEWSIPYIAASGLVGAVVCFAGFWILFRPLHWKVEKSWYRLASAAVIAAAVCFLHFFGMLSATYIADSTQNVGVCTGKRLWGWNPDQLLVLCVGIAVLFVAFIVEHSINNELRLTYRQLLDIRLTGSDFDEMTSSDQLNQSGKRQKVRRYLNHRSSTRISGLSPEEYGSSQFRASSTISDEPVSRYPEQRQTDESSTPLEKHDNKGHGGREEEQGSTDLSSSGTASSPLVLDEAVDNPCEDMKDVDIEATASPSVFATSKKSLEPASQRSDIAADSFSDETNSTKTEGEEDEEDTTSEPMISVKTFKRSGKPLLTAVLKELTLRRKEEQEEKETKCEPIGALKAFKSQPPPLTAVLKDLSSKDYSEEEEESLSSVNYDHDLDHSHKSNKSHRLSREEIDESIKEFECSTKSLNAFVDSWAAKLPSQDLELGQRRGQNFYPSYLVNS